METRKRLELTVVGSVVLALLVALPVMAGDGGTYPYPAPDTGGLAIAGVGVAILTALLTQEAKKLLGLEGNAVRVLALCLGIVLSGLALAAQDGMITGDALRMLELVVLAIAGGFGSSGLYSLVKLQK